MYFLGHWNSGTVFEVVGKEQVTVTLPANHQVSNATGIGNRVKVGQMTWTIWVTWVTFLEGQVGLIRKLNYLDVTQIAITCTLENSLGIW